MPRITAVSTANPENVITQSSVIDFAKQLYRDNKLFMRLLPVFDSVMVDKRHLTVDLEWLGKNHSFDEINDLYIETAVNLSETVALDVANKSGVPTQEFDAIFFMSTTGLSTPTIDARLFNRIPLNPHIKRIPIWGLGCAAGAGGLARAYDYLLAYPTHKVLVIAVELCSLAFQLNDPTKINIVSAALFGDGAAACVLVGDQVPNDEKSRPQPQVLGSFSTIYPESLDVMSWRVTSGGFKVQLSKDIPSIVTSQVKENISEFIQDKNVELSDLTHFIFHPGGTRVLQAYAEGLGITKDKLAYSYDVLRDFGNMSSVTVFFVLKKFLENTEAHSGEYGLVGALGPGFSSELVLLKWT